MIGEQFEEREVTFSDAMSLLKNHESVGRLIEEVKLKVTKLESMIINYQTSERAFEAKRIPLSEEEINILTKARESFWERIIKVIPAIESEFDVIEQKFRVENTELKSQAWNHIEPQVNIYLRVKSWFEKLKNFDKSIKNTTISS